MALLLIYLCNRKSLFEFI